MDKYKDKEKRIAYLKKWRSENRDKTRAHCKKWYDSKGLEHFKDNRERTSKYRAKLRRDNPLVSKARDLYSWAVKSGKLMRQPCELCNSTENVHGHHEDYTKPLEVRWLCRKHHGEAHRKYD